MSSGNAEGIKYKTYTLYELYICHICQLVYGFSTFIIFKQFLYNFLKAIVSFRQIICLKFKSNQYYQILKALKKIDINENH
jgi:hypothetical protein